MARTKIGKGKCPPGVICIENLTLSLIFVFIIIVGIILYNYLKNIWNKKNNSISSSSNINNIKDKESNNNFISSTLSQMGFGFDLPHSFGRRGGGDILRDPYEPPLKDNPFYNPVQDVRGEPSMHLRHPLHYGRRVAINIPTRNPQLQYRQVGILTRNDGSETILPLFGRPIDRSRDKWQYYTYKDGNNTMVKLPISNNGRSCTNEYGCNEVMNGDNLYVEGYKDVFNAIVYENDEPRYIPY